MEFIKDTTSKSKKIEGMTVFNTKHVNIKKQPMFFGAPLGLQRYDNYKYPIFDKLTQQQLGYFWRPEEVSLQKDRADYQTLTKEQKHIFTSNLKYQVMLDSVQGRGPGMAFLPYCSLPELESAMTVWEMMEMIHSRSYTYIIKNVYSDPTEVFDTILDDANIMDRAKSVTEAYDDFIQAAQQYGNSNEWQHAQEGVYYAEEQLYELKIMEGSAKIISLIARDESQHLVLTQNIINKWKDGDDPDILKIAKEEEQWTIEQFKKTVDEEKRWAEYLFKDGSIIGLNEKLLSSYVEFIANRRMRAIGLKPVFDTPMSNNPLPWTQHWLSSKGLQVAPQETEVESYVIGGIKQDVKKDTFAGFQL